MKIDDIQIIKKFSTKDKIILPKYVKGMGLLIPIMIPAPYDAYMADSDVYYFLIEKDILKEMLDDVYGDEVSAGVGKILMQ